RELRRVGLTRFVSRITNTPRSGSIQMLVPVNPVWPNERGEKKRPELAPGEGVSQPIARLDRGFLRAVQRAMVFSFRMRTPPYSPPLSIMCAKIDRSRADENRPA